ncbi:hypothetical protein VTN96DRAFT_1934 [Rasamsonia emersonii]
MALLVDRLWGGGGLHPGRDLGLMWLHGSCARRTDMQSSGSHTGPFCTEKFAVFRSTSMPRYCLLAV